MNFKKIAITGAAAALMLASVVPALAYEGHRSRGGDVELNIQNEDTNVRNRVLTVSNTGLNEVEGGNSRHHSGGSTASINTGNAWSSSDVLNDVNSNDVDLCGCLSDRRGGDVEVDVENEDTNVSNRVLTVSNSGLNEIEGRGRIRTGNAGSESIVTNVVNTNVVN